jgi:2-haloacid dehalogenase
VGAKTAGVHTAFVARRNRPFGNEYYPPTLVVDDFAHLASQVISRVKG